MVSRNAGIVKTDCDYRLLVNSVTSLIMSLRKLGVCFCVVSGEVYYILITSKHTRLYLSHCMHVDMYVRETVAISW